MYSRFGMFGFILLISGISGILNGKYIYEKRKRIETLEEKIIDLNIELLKCKHELNILKEKKCFRESYLQLEKCMKRIENKEDNDNKESKFIKSDKNITDSDSFENLNQLDNKSSSEDSSKSRIEPEFESDDERKFNPLTNPSNEE